MGKVRFISSFVILLPALVPLSAQWLHYPTPGIPRTPDGKPNLAAPAPKTADGKPDFSGIWVTANGKYLPNLAIDGVEVPFQPWAAALYKERQANHGMGRPSERCLTHGVTDFDALATPRRFVQTPGMIVILFESYNHWRQIFLDGRGHPKDADPTWTGHSTGKWEGDVLVVDTVGFNDKTWLYDNLLSPTTPHTEKLHLTTRIRRPDSGHLEIEVTFDDPGTFTKPWKMKEISDLAENEDVLEWICTENNQDVEHLVGK